MKRTDVVGIDMACHMRKAITDLPEPVPVPDMADLMEKIQDAANTLAGLAAGVAAHVGEPEMQGGMDDTDVIATLLEAEQKGVDLTEHNHFPFVLAARHGRVEVMRYIYGRKHIRPSEEALLFALTDALDAGHLAAAKFCGKRVLGTALSAVRKIGDLEARVEKAEQRQEELEPVYKLADEARRIIEKEWTPGEWPPNRETAMFLMQLAVKVGRLTKPGWKPEGVNDPLTLPDKSTKGGDDGSP